MPGCLPFKLRKEIAVLISFLLYLGIFLVSAIPGSALPAKIPDIIPHFCEYAILAFFFIQVFNDPASRKTMTGAFLGLLLLGFFDEVHQAFVPDRFCSLKDLLFDALGSAFGLLAYRCLAWIRSDISD
jgi:VanZ family protein